MKRWPTSLGSLLLLGGCRMLAPRDKRPSFEGGLRKPAWVADGIAAESLAASPEVTLVVGRSPGRDAPELFALETASGRRLWTSSVAAERVAAMGRSTAFVLEPGGGPPSGARLRWIDLAAGRELEFSHRWKPFEFGDGRYYGFDEENYLVAIGEDGRVLQRAYTAFVSPLQLAMSGPDDADGVAAALGRTANPRQQLLAVFDRRTLRRLWSVVLPLPEDWVGRTDLVVGEGAVFTREYEIRMEGDRATTRAFDARTGAEKWQRADGGETRAEDGLMGLDSGVLLLKKPYQGYTSASATADLERQGLGYDPSPFFVTGIDPLTGKDRWTANLFTRGHEGMTASGGLLYSRDMKYYAVVDEAGTATRSSWLTCVDPAGGRELWRTEVQPETYYTNPVAAGGVVLVGARPQRERRGMAMVLAFHAGR